MNLSRNENTVRNHGRGGLPALLRDRDRQEAAQTAAGATAVRRLHDHPVHAGGIAVDGSAVRTSTRKDKRWALEYADGDDEAVHLDIASGIYTTLSDGR